MLQWGFASCWSGSRSINSSMSNCSVCGFGVERPARLKDDSSWLVWLFGSIDLSDMWHVLAIFFPGTAILTWQGTAAEALRWFAWEDNDTLGEMSRGASRITTRIQCCFLSLVNITHVFGGSSKRYHMNVQVCFTCMTSSVFILWLRLVPNIAFCERRSWSPKWRWSPCRCVTDAWRDMAWCSMTCHDAARRSSCLGSKHSRSSSRIAGSHRIHGIKWDHWIASQDNEQVSWSRPT